MDEFCKGIRFADDKAVPLEHMSHVPGGKKEEVTVVQVPVLDAQVLKFVFPGDLILFLKVVIIKCVG